MQKEIEEILQKSRNVALTDFTEKLVSISEFSQGKAGKIFSDVAKNNADYFFNGYRGCSAHYFVDETSIWQSVLDEDASWHCGGGLQGSAG